MSSELAVTRAWRRPVLKETVWLMAICLLDAAYTLVAVQLGWAKEANPLLAQALSHSAQLFVAVKALSFVAPLMVLELLRERWPDVIQRGIRAALLGYVALYLLGSIALLLKPH